MSNIAIDDIIPIMALGSVAVTSIFLLSTIIMSKIKLYKDTETFYVQFWDISLLKNSFFFQNIQKNRYFFIY